MNQEYPIPSKILDGQTAVVTGGSSGIVAGISRILGEAGANVVVNYASSREGAEQVVNGIRGQGSRAVAVQADVSSIAPGAIRTPINLESWDNPEAKAELLKLIPRNRIGEPSDIARAALWLATDASDYVHGTSLIVDGGMVLYPGFISAG